MTNEKKQEYTIRMTQSNRTGLLVTIYDLFLEYIKDAKESLDAGDKEGFKTAIGNAQPVLSELVSVLDFQYEISFQLLEVYRYCSRCLATALGKGDAEELAGAAVSISNIRKAFYEISLHDNSPKLMKNSQKIYAGLTYGKGDLVETATGGTSRGFLV
ncbi:MAG: flagellar protein FliS [Lachnospiraceae bacterium]|nr:flagellar protein FliS [Lachnospiraceae bacterium]